MNKLAPQKILFLAGIVSALILVGSIGYVNHEKVKQQEYVASVINSQLAKDKTTSDDGKVFPTVSLEGRAHLDDAVARLGDKLPEVAAWYGYSPASLRTMLKNDHSLWLDKEAHLYYAEDVPEGIETVSSATESIAIGSLYPLEDTFKLHSNPDAKNVIYLDFDGMLISGTMWNTSDNSGEDIDAPAWDIDGDTSTFGTTERERIQRIWQRVAEDYAPFNVDVTTEQPPLDRIQRTSTSDEYYGTVALISPISSYFGNYGGIAYVGIYNMTNNIFYQPALVFSEKLQNNEKYIAEAISHEVGHNFGLSHDGTTDGTSYYGGSGVWAPIMGSSYYKKITQWSKGEYPLANNTQDDISIIASKGPSVLVDDCGSTLSSACILGYSSGSVFADGLIERAGDTDFYSFMSDAGSMSITVTMHPSAPNLNARVKLLDGSGNTIATASDSYTSVVLTATVESGTYYISVQGVAGADFTNYASLGQYQISGTVNYTGSMPPVATASANVTSGKAPLTVDFSSDGSYDPDGLISSYTWSFGDGATSNEVNPTHIFTASGTYSVSLTVTDEEGFSSSDSVTVSVTNNAPVAEVTASPIRGNIPLEVAFDGTDSYDVDGTIVAYDWVFGDGMRGSGMTITHTYEAAGTFVAQLTVTDNEGVSNSAPVTISVVDLNAVAAPTDLAAVNERKTSNVNLTWTDNADNETSYEVYRALYVRKATPSYTLMATLSADSESYSETTPGSGTYLYYVRAVNATAQTEAVSETVSVRIK